MLLKHFNFAGGDDITTAGSFQFDFKAVEAATDNFSERNKLGQGGFGEVYKVYLPVHWASWLVGNICYIS